MLPITLLNAAQGLPVMVELKSGETVNGYVLACDMYMNMTLKDVVHTSADGKEFKKLPETYLRGTVIKYVQLPESLLAQIKDEHNIKREELRRQAGQA